MIPGDDYFPVRLYLDVENIIRRIWSKNVERNIEGIIQSAVRIKTGNIFSADAVDVFKDAADENFAVRLAFDYSNRAGDGNRRIERRINRTVRADPRNMQTRLVV